MKLSYLVAAILTVSTLSVTSVAVAQVDTSAKSHKHNKAYSRMHSQQHNAMKIFKSVDLTAEQQQQIQLLIQQHKAERRSENTSKQQSAATKAAMTQLMQADYFDQVQAEQLIQQRQLQQQQRQLQRLKLRYDMLQVLTPEQRQQITDAKKNNHPHRQAWFQHNG